MADIMSRLEPSRTRDRRAFYMLEPILETFASLFPEAFVKKYQLKFGCQPMHPLAFLCAFQSKDSLREHVCDLLRRHDLLPEAASEALHLHLSRDCIPVNLLMMKWLLSKQPDMVSKSDLSGYLPLHHACFNGKELKVIKVLVEANPVSLTTKTKKGEVPIQLAVRLSSVEVIRYLMERQDPKPTEDLFLDHDGVPLLRLLDNKNLRSVKYIFEIFTTLLTAQLPTYGSPLHYVLHNYGCYNDIRARVVLLLRLCGRAASMKNEDGEIPLQLALKHGDCLHDKTLVDLVRAYPESMDAVDKTTGKPIVDFPTAKRIIGAFCLFAGPGQSHSIADYEEPPTKTPSQKEPHDDTAITDDAPPKQKEPQIEPHASTAADVDEPCKKAAPQNESPAIATADVEPPKKKVRIA